jgi:hypothetical protein
LLGLLQLSDPQPAVDQLFLHCSIRKRLTIIVWQQAACTESGSRLPQSKKLLRKKKGLSHQETAQTF